MAQDVSNNNADLFKNSEGVPLEDLKLKIKTDGISEIVNALNERWAEERYFLHYEPPNIYNDDGSEISGAKDRWIEIINYINEDIQWLLKLPFYRFWSNIVYNTSILDTVVSFLQEAPPFYALENFPLISEMRDALETLRHSVLILFSRLVTNKESSTEYMSRAFHGSLLYDNYIFTIPIIFDLCQLYGRENHKTIEKILKCLFTLQPLYNNDLQSSVPCLIEAFENVQTRFGHRPLNEAGRAVSLTERKDDDIEFTLLSLEDVIIYVLDISSTIFILLKNYPLAVDAFRKEAFMIKIVSVYENIIPEMYNKLNELAFHDIYMPKYMELKHRLDVCRIEILNLYRTIIYSPIQNIQLQPDTLKEDHVKELVDDYINLLSNAISEREFIMDYHNLYPVGRDMKVITELCPEIDTIKCDYLLQSVYATIRDSAIPVANIRNSLTDDPTPGPSRIQSTQTPMPTNGTDGTGFVNEAEKSIARDSVDIAGLVTEVKDILCDYGEGFIERCLQHFNYNTESVINAILEDTLPPNLKELDITIPYIPPDPMEASAAVDLAIGGERLNVFDNDEFDIMTKDSIDLSRVHIGKRKDRYKDINEMLNDKSEVKKASAIYNKYNLVPDNYDDEYDDTYDSIDVRGATQDEPTEIDAKLFTTPRVLLEKVQQESISDDDSDIDQDNLPNQQNGKDNFCQNPAELRAKAEQRRQSVCKHKTSHNVVGNPKGHGQDKDVLANRNKKSTHKATRANHNRRAGAQAKRNQGMI